MSADRLALPASVKVRAVGRVNWREIVVSGSLRGGYCEVRCRVMTTVSRSAAEAVPRLVSICVGICTTWCTCWPGISISEKPTADAAGGGAVLFVVESIVTRKVWKVRAGKVSVCPEVTCDEAFSSTVTGSLPSNVSVTFDTQRERSPRWGCTSVM